MSPWPLLAAAAILTFCNQMTQSVPIGVFAGSVFYSQFERRKIPFRALLPVAPLDSSAMVKRKSLPGAGPGQKAKVQRKFSAEQLQDFPHVKKITNWFFGQPWAAK